MISNWTLGAYRKLLCCILETNYKTSTISNFITHKDEMVIALRHDIDRAPINALEMALLEHELGICSTYYLRFHIHKSHPQLASNIQDLGHEVGYHFETLSKCNGNFSKAVELFKNEVSILRKSINIETSAAHGSPLSPHNNKSLIDETLLRSLNLTGDAYYSIDYSQVAYFTDTGRSWNSNRTNLRDRVENSQNHNEVEKLEELIELIKAEKIHNICIQTHPERWSFNTLTYIRSKTLDLAANQIKRIISIFK